MTVPMEQRSQATGQFVKFAVVGGLGFLADAGSLQLLISQGGVDPYGGRVLSFLAAVTLTWSLNRLYTFRTGGPHGAARQWLRYLGVSLLGVAVNYLVYAAMVFSIAGMADRLYLAVAAGSLAALPVNFFLSRSYAFSSRRMPAVFSNSTTG